MGSLMQKHGKMAFTLIELLTVMAIMAVMAAIGLSSYFGMTRGSGMRVAISHLRSTLLLARQTAIMQGRRTLVLFDQSTTNASYVICRQEGTITWVKGFGGVVELQDLYADWSDIRNVTSNSLVYNLDLNPPEAFPIVKVEEQTGIWTMRVKAQGSDWRLGDRYGWDVHARSHLPKGYQFEPGATPGKAPDPISFAPDGSTAQKKVAIRIYEKIRPNSDDAHGVVKVAGLTGMISVDIP